MPLPSNKSPDTLIKDINKLLNNVAAGKGLTLASDKLAEFCSNVAMKLNDALIGRGKRKRPPKTLYMSEVGKPCRRQLWYEVNRDTNTFDVEKLPANAIVKFLYGDILEELVLILCELSGHEVTDKQKSLEMKLPNGWVLRGRIDAKIDGEIVDVKSASTQSFVKFTKGVDRTNDPFGYIPQLQSYNVAADVTAGETTSFIAIDKTTGNIVRDEHKVDSQIKSKKDLQDLTATLEASNPPPRQFNSVATSYGNESLGLECSYCHWKHECWKDANGGKGIRTFVYSRKPVHLVKIKKVPDMVELKRDEEEKLQEV